MSASDQKPPKLFPDPERDDLSSHFHRQLIGYLGMLLPILLWLFAGWRPEVERPWAPLASVSAYYYSGAVSAFAGLLIALALFFFSYRGYANPYYLRDRAAAIVAGAAAVVVALFPTRAPLDSLAPSWWTPLTGIIHLSAAGVLFTCFIFFSLFQFPKSSTQIAGPLPGDKRIRNVIYISCGLGMVLCMAWIVYALSVDRSIFLPEVLALEFFAISWLVKGRAYSTAAALGSRSVYYAGHPRELAKDTVNAVRGQPDAGRTAPRKDP